MTSGKWLFKGLNGKGFAIAIIATGFALAGMHQGIAVPLKAITLDYNTPTDTRLQAELESIDKKVRSQFGMNSEESAAGVLDLKTGQLAMIHPDRGEYAASIPKIGILLAYFHLRPEAATSLDNVTRHELGLMVKASKNDMGTKFSRELGLKEIQNVLNGYGFYDKNRGGGLWMGKHYAKSDERYGDPVGDNSHAATVRQLLRYYLLLEQGKLISPAASRTMREIFESPTISHDKIKFVKGLAGKKVEIIRKWGSYQNWLHDSAVVTGPGRHYILVGLTHHPKGNEYLEALAKNVDDFLSTPAPKSSETLPAYFQAEPEPEKRKKKRNREVAPNNSPLQPYLDARPSGAK